MEVVLATHEFWPGVFSCLQNMAEVIREKIPGSEVTFFKISQKGISFEVIKKLKTDCPDFLIIGGWDNQIRTISQNVNKQKTKIILMWCSPSCQIDLGGEIPRFIELLENINSNMIDYIAIPCENDYRILSKISDRFLYFPIYMNFDDLENNRIEKPLKGNGILDVDMFCGPCPRKNIFAQILSILPFRDKIRLNLNYKKSTAGEPYVNTLSSFSFNVNNYDWLSREDYLKILQSMDVGMQVSISESFNYVAAEHIYYKIPILCSSALPYMKSKELSPITIFSQENISEINTKFNNLINDISMQKEIMEVANKELIAFNKDNKEILASSILEVVGK